MARLYDSSRLVGAGYNLAALSDDFLKLQESKEPMKSKFGVRRIKKDGNPAKESQLPPLEEIQRNPNTILPWIDYCTLDTEATWFLRYYLKYKYPFFLSNNPRLKTMEWEKLDKSQPPSDMWKFYKQYWRPFGEILTDMEREGIYVNTQYLKDILPKARKDRDNLRQKFINWVSKINPDYRYMNPTSTAQKQQLLFAPRTDQEGSKLKSKRVFKVPNIDNYIEEGKTKPKKNRFFYHLK